MGRPPRHPALQYALRVRAAVRADYQQALEAMVSAAEAATRGNMTSRHAPPGLRLERLWLAPWPHARRWASPELLDHWADVHRLTWAEYEAQRLEAEGLEPVATHRWGEAVALWGESL